MNNIQQATSFSRRDFLKAAGAASVAALLAVAFPPGTATAAAAVGAQPNIVYILADDLGYGDVSCLNPESKIPTPNMDRLAQEGMKFTDAHSGSAVCTPTRYGILTGRYCWRSRLKASVLDGYSAPLIDKNRMTVASLLKSQGYRTACVGKWHLGLDWSVTKGHVAGPENTDYAKPLAAGPTARGFDYYFGIPASLDMVPYVYVENDRVVTLPTDQIADSEKPAYYRGGPIAPGFKHGEVLPTITQKAVECIDGHAKNNASSPLFLYFPLTAPHTPIMPAKEFEGKSKAGVYGDFVCAVDDVVGRVVAALDRNGMTENTLIIVTSDNGCSRMVDFEKLHAMGHDPSYHFRGAKGDIFEGGHRIPFIARWPKHVAAGAVCDHPVCLTDLLATAAEITGAMVPDNAGEDSVSILPELLGKAAQPVREAVVHQSGKGFLSIRQGQWKLEFCNESEGVKTKQESGKEDLPPVQLYDLDTDVGEQHNVQDKFPEVVERLTRLMEKYVNDGRSTPGAPQQNDGKTSLWGPRGKGAGGAG